MIETERLYIRELIPEDWSALKRIALDFRRSKYVIYDYPFPTEDEKLKALAIKLSEKKLFFAVFLKDCEEMMGYVCFHYNEGTYEMGYCFHSAWHGHGYALESGRAVMDYVSQKYQTTSFVAGTAMKNEPSVKLLTRLGFVLIGKEMLHFYVDRQGNPLMFEGGNFVWKGNGGEA